MAHTKVLPNGNVVIDSSEVRDCIFPMYKFHKKEKDIELQEFLGTSFMLGKDFLITARHVVDRIELESLCALSVLDSKWNLMEFSEIFHHPNEDISALKMRNSCLWNSYITPSSSWEGSSCFYDLWGYPKINSLSFDSGNAMHRPDLCYYTGTIVRRITSEKEFLTIIGKRFFELNIFPYAGCSGAPLIKRESRSADQKWKMIGIYIGQSYISENKKICFKKFLEMEAPSSLEDQASSKIINLINKYSEYLVEETFARGVAVREDGIRDWLNSIDNGFYKSSG